MTCTSVSDRRVVVAVKASGRKARTAARCESYIIIALRRRTVKPR